MHFDLRLWRMTQGCAARIALAVLLGLLALGFGIARFVFLGRFLAGVFQGAPAAALVWPLPPPRVAIVLRAALDHGRTMVAHRTATRVQETLRGRLYDKIVALGPAWFGAERTGGVMLSMVDGVEQLQTLLRPVPAAGGDRHLSRRWRSSRSSRAGTCRSPLVMLAAALFTLVLPATVQRAHRPRLARAAARVQGVRRGIPRRGAGPADAEGVRPERRLRPDAGGQGARAVATARSGCWRSAC